MKCLRPTPPPPRPKPEPRQAFVITGAPGDPLEIFREGLALARRAGMPWPQAQAAAREAALSVESDKRERDEWAIALDSTRTAWMSAYERRPTACAL